MNRSLILVLLMVPSFAFSQSDSSKRRADVLRFADGVVQTYTAPLRWKSKDWLKFGGILATTAALTTADQPVRAFWSAQNSKTFDRINEIGYHYGKPYSAFIFSGSFYAVGMLFKDQWARETGLALSTSLLTTGLMEMGLKPLIGRARPSKEEGNYSMRFFNEEAGYHSFPSGHSSIAFTISFVMAKRTKSIPLKIFFYSLATSTAVCRLYSDAHWVSDIAFGSALAWYASEAAIERLKKNSARKAFKKTKVNLSPFPGGLTLRATFN